MVENFEKKQLIFYKYSHFSKPHTHSQTSFQSDFNLTTDCSSPRNFGKLAAIFLIQNTRDGFQRSTRVDESAAR